LYKIVKPEQKAFGKLFSFAGLNLNFWFAKSAFWLVRTFTLSMCQSYRVSGYLKEPTFSLHDLRPCDCEHNI